MSRTPERGRLLVIGGGISGITAAVQAAESGLEVVLVEKEAFLGGRVARTNQYFPKLCPPACGLEINLRRFKTHPGIRHLTLAEVERIEGEAGDYHVTIRRKPRYVNGKCTACGDCLEACPVERPDAFNMEMSTTRAVYLPHPMAFPLRMVIDDAVCPGPECGECVPACPYDAIDLTMPEESVEVDVDAVILATGWVPYDATRLDDLGFGTEPDVITNVLMERLASPTGPTGGEILRPSDHRAPDSVAFVQCAGSRDENHLRHCSGVCCMGSLKQARYVRERYPEAEIYVFYIDVRAPGRLEDFYRVSQDDERLHLVKGKVARVESADGSLVVEAEDTASGTRVHQRVDLVVLATGIVASATDGIAVDGGLRTDDHGFLTRRQPAEAVFPVGCATRPADVATCVRDATRAVTHALHFCTE